MTPSCPQLASTNFEHLATLLHLLNMQLHFNYIMMNKTKKSLMSFGTES